ncbi:phospholipase A1-Igamma1, chloroplastic-like [Phragmites australis]|uniref:phospholipase A1-Igamma1, chloroplastic-like n=1 Tax=Phragmites australis TaxID=29695 RepID=UPI002D797374|nr:phospholipase A1-Igamma1, chloroplastic-like [Phragmites australis]
MAPVSCRDLPRQLPILPRRATIHTPLSFQRAPAPGRPLTTTRSTSTSTLRLRSAATRDDAVASLVGQLEHDVEHAQYRDDVEEEEEELYAHDDAPGGGRRGAGKQHQDELPARWREIHGSDDWAGLLDPMDQLLRSELIRYGELAQACYDAFDYDPSSRYCGSCKYSRRDFFERLGMPGAARGYAVSRYLYATSNFRFPNLFPQSRAGARIWSQSANWIGYVAVSTDEESARLGRRDVAIAWRGTVTRLEWVADLMDFLRPVADEGIPCQDPEVKVLSGFVDLYTDKDPTCRFCKYSAREQVLMEVRRLVGRYTALGEDVSITVTGHSLGSALAMLSAYDIAESSANLANDKTAAVCVYSFGGPRVGNAAFKRRFEAELGVKALRVVNVHDNVPRMPGILLNEGAPEAVRRVAEGLLRVPWCYHHVGVELAIDHKRSPFLKDTLDPACYHNLEAHLHLLDGYHGHGERFVLASGRDPALVNKACDFLKDHHGVPPCWRQDENKGMVRGRDGRWVQPDRHGWHLDDDDLDDHHHDGRGTDDARHRHHHHHGHDLRSHRPSVTPN